MREAGWRVNKKRVERIWRREGLKIACVEEVVFQMGYIDSLHITKLAQPMGKNGYGEYLLDLVREKEKI